MMDRAAVLFDGIEGDPVGLENRLGKGRSRPLRLARADIGVLHVGERLDRRILAHRHLEHGRIESRKIHNVRVRLRKFALAFIAVEGRMGIRPADLRIAAVDGQNVGDAATRLVRRADAFDVFLEDLHDLGAERIP